MNDVDIRQELRSAKFRWFITILTIANAGYIVAAYLDTDVPEMHFPFHLKGSAVMILFSLTLALFVAIASTTWVMRAKETE